MSIFDYFRQGLSGLGNDYTRIFEDDMTDFTSSNFFDGVKDEDLNIKFNTMNVRTDITTAQKIVAYRFADAIQHSTEIKWI